MRPLRFPWLAFRRDELGAGMVEFALVTAFVLVPMVFGVIEFGRLIWAKNMVTAAAREGVRYAIVHGTESPSLFDSAAVATYVEGRTQLSPIKVSTTWTGSKEPLDTVTVTVKYTYTPVMRVISGKTITGVSKQVIAF